MGSNYSMELLISEETLTQGQCIRLRRIAKRWRQCDLAVFAGVGADEISRMELDRRVRPNALKAVLELLGLGE